MEIDDENFSEYKNHSYSHWQKIILIISYVVAALVFCMEWVSFFIFCKIDALKSEEIPRYLLIRNVIPGCIIISSVIAETLLVRTKRISLEIKNYVVVLGIFVLCSVLTIFHNYFVILLVAPVFPFIIGSVFGNLKLLKRFLFLTIPVIVISSVTFWFDKESRDFSYRFVTIVGETALVVCTFILSRSMLKSQQRHLRYIHQAYRRQSELVEELRIEPLTKLYNRSALEGDLTRIIVRAKSEKIQPFVVMMDIDFFKKVNDRWGHLAGDEVLVRLSQIIRENIGSVRKAFRYGGEEFVLLFEDSIESSVVQITELIRQDFASIEFPFAPEERFTLSAGIALLTQDMDEKQWIESADHALYYAKEHGRDQIKIFEP